MDILVLDNIRKGFPDGEGKTRIVLDGVSLRLAEGEFLAVTGPSGSGKTTLLKIAGSLLPPDSGKCLVEGIDPALCPDISTLRNRKIGFIFQDHRLLPQLTILQNVLLPALAGSDRVSDETRERALSLLDYTGIRDISDKYPASVSGGEAGRAAVCRALVMKPRLILADEPTGQLDRDNALKIASLLGRISRDFRTGVVMVTHSDEIASLADRQVSLYG